MAWVFNPFTGTFDCTGGTAGWAFNPFTGQFDKKGASGGWVFNPFTGTLDLLATTPAITTWQFDPATTDANITLTGGNKIATSTLNITGFRSSIGSQVIAAGQKVMFSVQITAYDLANPLPVVVAISNASAFTGNYLGDDANAVGIVGDSRVIWSAGTIFSGGPTFGATNDIIDVCVDTVNYKLWYRVNNGLWNGSGTADPTLNIGGYNFISLLTAPIGPGVSINAYTGVSPQTQWTAKTTATYAAPTGFTFLPAG